MPEHAAALAEKERLLGVKRISVTLAFRQSAMKDHAVIWRSSCLADNARRQRIRLALRYKSNDLGCATLATLHAVSEIVITLANGCSTADAGAGLFAGRARCLLNGQRGDGRRNGE